MLNLLVLVLCLLSFSICIRLSEPVSPKNSPQMKENLCTFCDILTKLWIHEQQNKNENKLEYAIEKVCKELPNPVDKQCSEYVNKRGLGILKLVNSNWSSDRICREFGNCALSFHEPPSNLINQNGHIDENDMPKSEELSKPELVAKSEQITSLRKNLASNEQNNIESSETTQHGSEPTGFIQLEEGVSTGVKGVQDAVRDCRWLWNVVFGVAWQWMHSDKSDKSSFSSNKFDSSKHLVSLTKYAKSTKHESNLLQIETENDFIAFRNIKDNHLAILDMVGQLQIDSTNFNSQQHSTISKMAEYLEKRKKLAIKETTNFIEIDNNNSNNENKNENLLKEEDKPIVNRTLEYTNKLLGEFLELQTQTGVGSGQSWEVLVYTYWSWLYTIYIRGQVDGTKT